MIVDRLLDLIKKNFANEILILRQNLSLFSFFLKIFWSCSFDLLFQAYPSKLRKSIKSARTALRLYNAERLKKIILLAKLTV